MADIETKLDIWRNKLLDMGKRNPMLNYHERKRSTLRFQKPDIFSMWDLIVDMHGTLEFPREIPEEADDESDFLESESEIQNQEDEEPAVITNQTIPEQQKTLRNLRQKTKTILEEQGINVLYLSFEFLRWKESERSKDSFEAPLLLVPVTLTLESLTAPFKMRFNEEEILLNPSLVYKLQNDFGVNLPELEHDESLKHYLVKMEEFAVSNQWELISEVGLGLLQFYKINMYQDLDNHKEEILKHPIIRAIAGKKTTLNGDLTWVNTFDHDGSVKPTESFQVVDADSSQLDAILAAKSGYSFVLQGPPGTGKVRQ